MLVLRNKVYEDSLVSRKEKYWQQIRRNQIQKLFRSFRKQARQLSNQNQLNWFPNGYSTYVPNSPGCQMMGANQYQWLGQGAPAVFGIIREGVLINNCRQYGMPQFNCLPPQLPMPNRNIYFEPFPVFKNFLKADLPAVNPSVNKQVTATRNADIAMAPKLAHTAPPYRILRTFKYYTIYDKLIGSGSYSKVYEGVHNITKEQVAVKVVAAKEINEKERNLNIEHRFIIRTLEERTIEQKIYLVLELCEGTLKEALNFCHYQSMQVRRYMQQIVEAMDALFDHGIIHRDLKFENILIKDKHIKIADFGLAKSMNNLSEVSSLRCGSPYTMAPEIFFSRTKAKYSPKSDIWSLGVLFHLMLYQVHPFNGDAEMLRDMRRVVIQPRYGKLDTVINRALTEVHSRIEWREFKYLFKAAFEVAPRVSITPQRIIPLRLAHEPLMKAQIKVGYCDEEGLKEAEYVNPFKKNRGAHFGERRINGGMAEAQKRWVNNEIVSKYQQIYSIESVPIQRVEEIKIIPTSLINFKSKQINKPKIISTQVAEQTWKGMKNACEKTKYSANTVQEIGWREVFFVVLLILISMGYLLICSASLF